MKNVTDDQVVSKTFSYVNQDSELAADSLRISCVFFQEASPAKKKKKVDERVTSNTFCYINV